MQGVEGRSLRSPEVLTPSQKLRDVEADEGAAAEDTPHHTSWGGRGRRGATGPYTAPDSAGPKRKRAQVLHLSSPLLSLHFMSLQGFLCDFYILDSNAPWHSGVHVHKPDHLKLDNRFMLCLLLPCSRSIQSCEEPLACVPATKVRS